MQNIPDREISKRIYLIRGRSVMLDRDLAGLYGVETKVLNQSVKRNLDRFPSDFMFQLNETEEKSLRSQSVTSNRVGRGGRRYSTTVFTELGIAMLSSVLNSEQAIHANIRIMRLFFELRHILAKNPQFDKRLSKLEKNSTYLFEVIFRRLDQLEIRAPLLSPTRRKIGL